MLYSFILEKETKIYYLKNVSYIHHKNSSDYNRYENILEKKGLHETKFPHKLTSQIL